MPIRALVLFLAFAVVDAADAKLASPKLAKIEPNTWLKVHEQKASDAISFMRQHHGGSCFDAKRGHFVHFGSNSHGKDWINSPMIFDVVKCEWSRVYPDDAFDTYKVVDGVGWCGPKGDHPWSMHTFGAVNYDSERDEMVVCCFDEHLKPGNFTDQFQEFWPKLTKKPTWIFDLAKSAWRVLPCDGVSFFPHSTTYDSDRHVVVGYHPDAIWELGGEPRTWTKACAAGGFGYSQNCAYDAKNKAVVIFGAVGGSDQVGVYWTQKKTWQIMPTTGKRPPKDQHCAMEYYPRLGKTVVMVDRTKEKDGAERDTTETWLYDLAADAWTQIDSATLPFASGMNLNMEYDPNNDALWFMTGGYTGEGPTSMYALKLDEPKAK